MINAIELDGRWRLAHSDGRRNRFGYAMDPDLDDRGFIDADRAWLVFEQLQVR